MLIMIPKASLFALSCSACMCASSVPLSTLFYCSSAVLPCSLSHIFILLCLPACPFPPPLKILYLSLLCQFKCPHAPPVLSLDRLMSLSLPTCCMLLCFTVPLPGFRSFACLHACCSFKDLPCLPACYTVKKDSRVSRPQPGCHYQTLPGRE